MNTVLLNNHQNGHTYRADGPVYETDQVWCGTGQDEQGRPLFFKLIRYGHLSPENKKQVLKAAEREAETMIRVRRCTDRTPELYDSWDDPQQNAYVLVMQKLPGITLRRWMQTRPLDPNDPRYETAIWVRSLILRQVAQILRSIHIKIPGINHLDLKPENVMIWQDESKKWQVGLIDFGTAALDHTLLTGTFGYQSPERISRMGTVMGSGEAKDVFSLGVLWYELLTGCPQEDLAMLFLPSLNAPEWEVCPQLPESILSGKSGNQYRWLFEKMIAFLPATRPHLEEVIRYIPVKR